MPLPSPMIKTFPRHVPAIFSPLLTGQKVPKDLDKGGAWVLGLTGTLILFSGDTGNVGSVC